MIIYSNNKNKVNLEDYPYKLDIHRRRCVSRFTPFERDLFYEMCLGSVETSVETLAEDMDVDPAIILTILRKNSSIGLYTMNGRDITISKEERKLYEVELEKFNEAFLPNLNHIKALFQKVPIDVLPTWFSLPKSCNAIFPELVEKHFATPRLFERYLKELEFDDPVLNRIVRSLYKSEYYSLSIEELKENLYLSDEVLYQIIAILEFNLVAVHSYQKIGEQYFEVITPPHEYRALLLNKLERKPKPIDEDEKTIAVYTIHQNYIPRVTKTLKTIKDLMEGENKTKVQYDDLALVKRLLEMDLLKSKNEQILISKEGESFLNQSESDKIHYFRKKRLFSDTVQRQIEKALLPYDDWIFVDDFINSLQIPLDNHSPLELVRKGRQSYYSLPAYTEEEVQMLRKFLCEHLAVANLIELGEVEERTTFRLTQLGRDLLS